MIVWDKTPRAPGLNPDGTVTILHGTNEENARRIRDDGFRAGNPRAVAERIAARYGVDADALYRSVQFEFPRKRIDLDRIFFTTDAWTAAQYTMPEVEQDALSGAWVLLHGWPPEEQGPARADYLKRQEAWFKKEDAKVRPFVLAVTLPRAVIGKHAWSRQMTKKDWDYLESGEGSLQGLLFTVAIPVRDLQDARLSPAVRTKHVSARF